MNYLNTYKQASVNTASPGRLLIMLFDGLIRFITQAKNGIESGQIEASHKALCRAQDIVLELRETLDHEKAPELCENLYGLYSFFYQQLVEVNKTKDVSILNNIVPEIKELRDAFEQAERTLAAERTE